MAKKEPPRAATPKLRRLVRSAAQVVLDNLEARQQGREINYHPGFCHIAERACIISSTNVDLAEMFGASTTAITFWQNKYPDFARAVAAGKARADEQVEKSLAHRANGYSYEEEVLITVAGPRGSGSSVERHKVKKHFPPDPTSMIFFLKNRKPQDWRERQPDGADSGDPPAPVSVTINFKDARRRVA